MSSKYHKIGETLNVYYFVCFDEEVIISTKENSIISVNKNDGKIKEIKKKLLGNSLLAKADELVFFQSDTQNELSYYNTKSGELIKAEIPNAKSVSFQYHSAFTSSYVVIAKVDQSEKTQLLAFNLIEEKIVAYFESLFFWTTLLADTFVFGTLYNGKDNSTIVASNRENGKNIWELDLSGFLFTDRGFANAIPQPSEIRTLIGVNGNQLIVFLTGNQLVGIDINTGKILWHIADLLDQFPQNESVSGHWYWHLQEGNLYLLKHKQYFKINLKTQQIELLHIIQDVEISVTHCTYTETHVYFTATQMEGHSNGIAPNILGSFNRKTYAIEWLEKTDIFLRDKWGSFNAPPQTDGDRLYFLDSTGTLHIYERQNLTKV